MINADDSCGLELLCKQQRMPQNRSRPGGRPSIAFAVFCFKRTLSSLVANTTYGAGYRICIAMLTCWALCSDAAYRICFWIRITFLTSRTRSSLTLLALHACLSRLTSLSGLTRLPRIS
jgi:hypothetical protein